MTEMTVKIMKARRIIDKLSYRGMYITLIGILTGHSIFQSLLVGQAYKDIEDPPGDGWKKFLNMEVNDD